MSRQTYKGALDAVLLPMGFEVLQEKGVGKRERLWTRDRGGFQERVLLQYSQYLGMTANFLATDLESERLWIAATGSGAPEGFTRVSQVPGREVDCWFKGDPNGPATLAQMVSDQLEPFLAGRRSLEDRAMRYGRGLPPRGDYAAMIGLAITLYRMGQFEEATATLNPPPRRTANEYWLGQLERARAWLEPRLKAAAAGAETKT